MSKFLIKMSGKPYYHIRIVNGNMHVIYEWYEEDKGQKAVINNKAKFAGIIPKTPLIQKKQCRELTYHENDARPITEQDMEDYQKEISKLKPQERYHLFFTRDAPLPTKINPETKEKELDIGKIIGTHPITKEIPGRWLYETLKSNFIPQIMQTPEEKFSWLKDVAIIAFIAIGFIGGMYFLSKIITGA